MSQTPSVSRVVLVTVNPTTNNGTDVAPAIITRVWSDEKINVQVLRDGTSGTQALTSIRLFPDREALDAARAEAQQAAEQIPNSTFTPLSAAYWPPRV